LADLIATNRRLTEETLYRLRKLELSMPDAAPEIEHVASQTTPRDEQEPERQEAVT
jgi:hypothetical protein